jgi:hypothetical protein
MLSTRVETRACTIVSMRPRFDVLIAGGWMARHKAAVVLCGICAVLSLTACAKPQYIVPGLTLPPGATVVTQKFRAPANRGFVLTFDCPGGWDVVDLHISGCLKRAGFKAASAYYDPVGNQNEGLEELDPVLADTADPGATTIKENYYQHTRYFRKQGYFVVLQLSAVTGDLNDETSTGMPGVLTRAQAKQRTHDWGAYMLDVCVFPQVRKAHP